jgi:hypothetical protein
MESGIFEAIRSNDLESVRTFPNVNVTLPDPGLFLTLLILC